MTADCPRRFFQTGLLLLVGMLVVFASLPLSAQQRGPKDDVLLTPEDIALIKVYEVKIEGDPPPRVVIPRDELRQFLKDYQEDDRIPRGRQEQDDWLRAEGHEQLALLFRLKAREYYKHVRIRSHVESLRAWSGINRRYILSYFQPTFGTGEVPELFLFPRGRDAERIEMTNFYILTQTSVDGRLLIDRNVPEESLLLQWGLPREEAKFPAPDVPGWEPEFKGLDDERFEEYVEWITSLIASNQGSTYAIDYTPPKHQNNQDQ